MFFFLFLSVLTSFGLLAGFIVKFLAYSKHVGEEIAPETRKVLAMVLISDGYLERAAHA